MKKLSIILPILALIAYFSMFALSSPTMRPVAKSLPDFTLVVSGQELGYLSPCGCAEGQIGGFPRRDSALSQLIRSGKTLLRLANGNLISNAGRQSELKAEIAFSAFKEMEYVAFNVGPRDLLLGIDQLENLSNTSEIPFLSANLFKGETHVFQPYLLHPVKLKNFQGKVAIVGIISKKYEIYAENADSDLMLKAPDEVLRKLIPKLSIECDFTVLLAHTDIDEAKTLAKSFPQIDVLIFGSEETNALKEPISIENTFILNPGRKGKALGLFDIYWDTAEKKEDSNFKLLTLTERIPDSSRMTEMLLLYKQMLAAENLTDNVEQVPLIAGGMYAGNKSCKSCHPAEYTSWKKTKHSHAYHTLVEAGHEKDPECLTCHTVGFGFETGYTDQSKTPVLSDVGCENCHGVGGNHVKNPQSGYGKVTKDNCLTCHTSENSPNFDYDAYFPKILHDMIHSETIE